MTEMKVYVSIEKVNDVMLNAPLYILYIVFKQQLKIIML